MKAALSACVFAAVALAAAAMPAVSSKLPEKTPVEPETVRQKRSNYGNPYMSPCGASSVPIPAVAPSPYHLNFHHGGYAPAPHYGYGLSPYRTDMGEEHEMMSFSDMDPMMSEHMPMARYTYAAPSAAHYGAGLGNLVAPSSSGTAFGVFPNANVGGCSVPLLLSCSPSIVPGKIVKTQPTYSYGGSVVPVSVPDAYRVVDGAHHESHEHTGEQPHDHMTPTHEDSHAGSGMHQ